MNDYFIYSIDLFYVWDGVCSGAVWTEYLNVILLKVVLTVSRYFELCLLTYDKIIYFSISRKEEVLTMIWIQYYLSAACVVALKMIV
jgi:hypothetical protein